MKSNILDILYLSSEYISGEVISKKLGVSRTAIWKHINLLKKEGYAIYSINNKGYKLVKENLPLNEYEVKRHYKGKIKLNYIKETDSTNTYAKKTAKNNTNEIEMVFTSIQKKGRGRLKREFISNNNEGIWASYVFKPNMEPQKATIFTLAASVAVCKLLVDKCGINAQIKWPNDIIVNNKKICGILTEMSCEMDNINYIITGIGINVLQKEFDKALNNIATSIYQVTKQKYDRGLLIAYLCYNIDDIYKEITNNNIDAIIKKWNEFSLTNGKEIKIQKGSESLYGKAIGIDKIGRLIVELTDGKREVFNSGEISIRGIMGYA